MSYSRRPHWVPLHLAKTSKMKLHQSLHLSPIKTVYGCAKMGKKDRGYAFYEILQELCDAIMSIQGKISSNTKLYLLK